MIWIMLYMVIGLIYCGYTATLAAQKLTEEKKYPLVTLLLCVIILVLVVSPLWPILMGMGMAGNRKKART